MIASSSASSAAAASQAPRSRASSTKVKSITEHANLRLTKNSTNVHEGQGAVTGTLRGSLAFRITATSAERATVSFQGYLHGGTLSGGGYATYRVSGSLLYFKGTTSILHGSGSYRHASGNGIHIEGTLNRRQNTVTLTISGRIRV